MSDPYDGLSGLEKELVAALSAGDRDEIARLEAEVDAAFGIQPPPPLHASALWYVHRGIPVFPLRPLRKKPFLKTRGLKDASVSVDRVNEWWSAHPNANIGIPSGLWFDIIDVDGLVGQESMARSPKTFSSLTILAKVSTPRPGGIHIWIPVTGGGNGAKVLPGVDYRGKGGYVVAPPSVLEELPKEHEDGPQCGGTYSFLQAPALRELPA